MSMSLKTNNSHVVWNCCLLSNSLLGSLKNIYENGISTPTLSTIASLKYKLKNNYHAVWNCFHLSNSFFAGLTEEHLDLGPSMD